MPLPAGLLAESLVMGFPQFVICDATLNRRLAQWLNPVDNQAMSEFVSWLQRHEQSAARAGAVLRPQGTPETGPVPLDTDLVVAMQQVLGQASQWIAASGDFQGIAWWQNVGQVPGPVAVQPVGSDWTLGAQAPHAGLLVESTSYAGSSATFELLLCNNAPRHLSVYVQFLHQGQPVVPQDWTSRLPEGARQALETSTEKYLCLLRPNVPVAALDVVPDAQSLSIALPDNADSLRLSFGGLNGSSWSAVPDAIAGWATYTLDMFLPWIASLSKKDGLAKWYQGILQDDGIEAQIIDTAALLAGGVSSAAQWWQALQDRSCELLASESMQALRDAIDHELGGPQGKDYTWFDQYAPAAGWPAQSLEPFVGGMSHPGYWMTQMPGSLLLDLAVDTSVAVELVVLSDPAAGRWPLTASSYKATLAYGDGYTQTLTGSLLTVDMTGPLRLGFGSVPSGAAIQVQVDLLNDKGRAVSTGTAQLTDLAGGGARERSIDLPLRDTPVSISADARYDFAMSLAYRDGSYVWDRDARPPTQRPLAEPALGATALMSMLQISLQGSSHALGVVWANANPGTLETRQGDSQRAYYLQNVGTGDPMAQLRRSEHGLISQPLFAYCADPLANVPGYFIDAGQGGAFLRTVTFQPGVFDTRRTSSVGRFIAGSQITSAVTSADGTVAALAPDTGLLQILRPATTAVADDCAPVALTFAGPGDRVGLLDQPVAVVAMGSDFLVLESGSERVQAFDTRGNSQPLFGGSAVFSLKSRPGASYLDMAVAGDGTMFVLGTGGTDDGGGLSFVDVYAADGSFLCQLPGIVGARLCVDASLNIYTLIADAIAGAPGALQPSIAVWAAG